MEYELFALRRLHKRPATPDEVETAFPFHRMGTEARGKTGIPFIHGFSVTPANFRGYAESLAADGYTVSVPLVPGDAGRPEDLIQVCWEDWLDAVLEAYDTLRGECEQVYVAGISLGGALALQLASRRDDIRMVFLLAPAVFPTPFFRMTSASLLPLLRKLGSRYWRHVAGDVKRADAFELGYGKTPLAGLLALSRCMKATQKLLPNVLVDVLIFQGRIDHEIPPRKAQKILKRLGSKRKALVWLDNSFHEIPRDHDSERVLHRIRQEIATSG